MNRYRNGITTASIGHDGESKERQRPNVVKASGKQTVNDDDSLWLHWIR